MSVKHPYYSGTGRREPGLQETLPIVDPQALNHPGNYRANPETVSAVDVALTLGIPLLVTGEPGSGKSTLAASIAWELGLELTRFSVKSDTESRDLFYRFDAVGRLQAAQSAMMVKPVAFIAFEALGRAILLAKHRDALEALGIPNTAIAHPGEPRRCVVLIDGIDKAPRDVPNDILNEIETMQFSIPELSGTTGAVPVLGLSADELRYRPIIIFTSNSERILPDPFVRRCAYHHLDLPPFKANTGDGIGYTVEEIVAARLGVRMAAGDDILQSVTRATDYFRWLRQDQLGLARRPTLAEFLDWLDYLMPTDRPAHDWTLLQRLVTPADPDSESRLAASISTLLLKQEEDQRRTYELLNIWRNRSKW